jgi:hypothetical protein
LLSKGLIIGMKIKQLLSPLGGGRPYRNKKPEHDPRILKVIGHITRLELIYINL